MPLITNEEHQLICGGSKKLERLFSEISERNKINQNGAKPIGEELLNQILHVMAAEGYKYEGEELERLKVLAKLDWTHEQIELFIDAMMEVSDAA